ncbi:hypothetical protein [Rhizobium sp. Leaf383]|uniref:hypothetical protein n=1 Tax=Rhizobium sp. Leaf383 TaxID=1736357 RepID=UPI000714802F|nr:hypothetical protein [Rhizobium sp. Leaf383]KQS76368.1 hypothetical protein ASG58_11090 [Rhizobium sp. Leaf383]
MSDHDKTYLYLALGKMIFTSVPVDDDVDQAIVSAVSAFADLRGTVLWIEDTEHGTPQRYEHAATARLGLGNSQMLLDITICISRYPTDDYVALASNELAKRFALS